MSKTPGSAASTVNPSPTTLKLSFSLLALLTLCTSSRLVGVGKGSILACAGGGLEYRLMLRCRRRCCSGCE